MKRYAIILTMSIMFLSGCDQNGSKDTSTPQDNSPPPASVAKPEPPAVDPEKVNVKLYDFKSAVLQYQLVGDDREGTKTIYIDDWGNRETMIQKAIFMGHAHQNEYYIMKGQMVCDIDMDKKTGSKHEARFYEATFNCELPYMIRCYGTKEEAINIIKRRNHGLEIQNAGEQEYAGYPCQVVNYASKKWTRRHWYYKGVILKTEYVLQSGRVHSSLELTQAEFDVDIDPKLFEVPEGVEIKVWN